MSGDDGPGQAMPTSLPATATRISKRFFFGCPIRKRVLSKSPVLENGTPGSGAAKLAAILVGESPTGRNCPVAAVVISSDGTGDQLIGSLEVKVS